jgi:hypothetical protein
VSVLVDRRPSPPAGACLLICTSRGLMSTTKRTTLLASASMSNKPVNQDSLALVRNERAGLSAAIVADGIGSHYGAETAAAIAVEALRNQLDQIVASSALDFKNMFQCAADELTAYVKSQATALPPGLHEGNSFGTTLLCVAETDAHIVAAYVGNGAILRIRGNFLSFPPALPLPWCIQNLLSPHSISENGRAALYKWISPWAPSAASVPDQICFAKNQDPYGEIVLACSDGLYSADQTVVGKDDSNRVWISAEPALLLLVAHLRHLFTLPALDDATLQSALEDYLAELQANGMVDDDCSVAALITEQALRYQASHKAHSNLGGLP